MYGFNYKLVTVNAEKNIVKLTPTLGTYAKAFAPAIIIWAVVGIAMLGSEKAADVPLYDNPFEEDDRLD